MSKKNELIKDVINQFDLESVLDRKHVRENLRKLTVKALRQMVRNLKKASKKHRDA